jgi:hypothetical protein
MDFEMLLQSQAGLTQRDELHQLESVFETYRSIFGHLVPTPRIQRKSLESFLLQINTLANGRHPASSFAVREVRKPC